ncbi:MAG: hypothetical protein IT368_13435 [Candidatus Hydrogenedentes bacterium]|nr:hypothetical protein [Candidatus Hydrogenedentota bacterium]
MTLAGALAFCLTLVAAAGAPASLADADYWLVNAARDHGFSEAEAAEAAGLPVDAAREQLSQGTLPDSVGLSAAGICKVLPYPGGRHPRIGFLEGAINPMRGTKASVFAPWDQQAYIVVDAPEAIFSNLGLIFLAHTHVPTYWDERNVVLPDVQWERMADGRLREERGLPNGITFGTEITPTATGAKLRMWLVNGTTERLTGLRTQVCVMLKGLPGFTAQDNGGKIYEAPVAVARAQDGSDKAVLTAWSHTGRAWGNPDVPCIHADPVFPDADGGARVEVAGEIVFASGPEIDAARQRLAEMYAP